MPSTQMAEACGVSQRQIYVLKTRFPKEVPASFNDVDDWKKFVDAHRVIVAAKRHAPRSDAGLQSDHSRYIAARARRTESLAESEAIRLAITKRNTIDRLEVEREFARLGSLMRGSMLKLLSHCRVRWKDCPHPLSNRFCGKSSPTR